MRAATGVLAVLLLGGSAAVGQTGGVASTAQAQPAEASQQTADAVADVPAVSFGPGAKVFLEPMDGFEQLVAAAIVKKKVPVVVVKDRAQADFVMSGQAHVKNRNFVTGMVLSTHGGGDVSIKDARTANQVFAYAFHRVDANERDGDIYLNWADQCAEHLKKTMKKAMKKT